MPIRLSNISKFALLSASTIILTGCAASKYTPAEQEMVDTMGASQYQPRTQLERDAVETQDLFAQAAFWSREYDLNPGDLEAAMKLSATLRKMGNPTQALEIAKTARALYPRDTNLLAEYAAGLVALEQGKQAISPLSRAVRQDPNNSRLWSLMGASHDQIGQFTKARDYYGRALALNPNDSNILANVGLSYALEGDARTAEIWLRRASETAPNVSVNSGGAREAAMAAARRMQENGGAKRTIPMSQSEITAQQDVLSRIGQSVAPKQAPASRPTYAQMQARAAQVNQQAQAQADAEARAAAQQAQMRAAQGRPAYPYQQQEQMRGQYPEPQGYRAPARRRE